MQPRLAVKPTPRRSVSVLLLALALALTTAASARDDPQPGFNLFSVEQDIEIGRQSAAQAERQLPVLRDARLEKYLNALARELVAQAPGARYPYRVRAVDSSEINAFTFPGGFLYINRGLIDATRNESELAGVLSHEIAHVALRHGTHQASKAYAAQAGLGILGGLLGGGGNRGRGQIIEAIGGLGLNAVFLKFSRSAEHEADLVGIRMMSRAGYDPEAMASFFELLKQQAARDPGRLEEFFSSHPAPVDRAARMRAEAERLGPPKRTRASGDYDRVQDELRDLPAPSRRTARIREGGTRDRSAGGRSSLPAIDPPSSRLRTFEQKNGFFEVSYPSNWRVYPADRGYGAVIAPDGGIGSAGTRGEDIVCGVVINHYDPFDDAGDGTLEDATNDLVAQIRRGSPHLRERGGSERRSTVDGAPALSIELAGTSPTTGEAERVRVLTRELTDGHVLYALFVTPGDDASRFADAFDRMEDSLRVNDRAVHR
jgi:beta-barrel assembly-enhancing protease